MNGRQFANDVKSIKEYDNYKRHMKEIHESVSHHEHYRQTDKRSLKNPEWSDKKAKLKRQWTELDQKLEDELWAS